MSLAALLATHAAHGADRPLVITPSATYTTADVERARDRIATWLRTIGTRPGDRVVVELKNGLESIAALFAVAEVGAIAVASSPQWMLPQLAYVLADSGARVLITSELRARQLGDRRPPHVLVDGACEGATSWSSLAAGDPVPAASVAPGDPAILIYTSGTTGRPKGVVHSHGNLEAFGRIVAGYLNNTADDRLLWLLNWNFGYGLSQLLTMCISGGCLIVPASMMPADVVKAFDEHRPTAIAQVPYGWDQLAGHLERTGRQLAGLRYVSNAGDGPSPALLDRLPHVFPGAQIILMYGQTECFRTTYLPADRYAAKRGAMGYAIPGVEILVEDETGAACAPGQIGELIHRGALVANGYWNDPEATARKFPSHDSLRTGDLVRRDDDGCLWYVGRSEHVIKSSGFRFGPREIEDVLRAHPEVADAAAFGVDDPALGQAVEVAVVGAVSPATVLAHLRPVLPRYMLPRTVHVLAEIPRNANGKIKVDELRALATVAIERGE